VAAGGDREFGAARPAYGQGGVRLPELRSLSHGAAAAVLSQARTRPPHPIHPTHPVMPKPVQNINTQYNNSCTSPNGAGCGLVFPELLFCDAYTSDVHRRANCPPIIKSKIVGTD
jgi:hypothetical protein